MPFEMSVFDRGPIFGLNRWCLICTDVVVVVVLLWWCCVCDNDMHWCSGQKNRMFVPRRWNISWLQAPYTNFKKQKKKYEEFKHNLQFTFNELLSWTFLVAQLKIFVRRHSNETEHRNVIWSNNLHQHCKNCHKLIVLLIQWDNIWIKLLHTEPSHVCVWLFFLASWVGFSHWNLTRCDSKAARQEQVSGAGADQLEKHLTPKKWSLSSSSTPLVRNMILVNRLALTCFYVGSQFETKTDQSSYVPKFFYELILNNRFFVDSPLLAWQVLPKQPTPPL